MIDAELEQAVTAEIEALHETFESWFRGDLDTLMRVDRALADDFTFVSPRGDMVSRARLMDNLDAARGSRDMRIRVTDTSVVWRAAHSVLAMYREWHDHADYSTERHTSVLFIVEESAPGGLLWKHVHETWVTPPPNWVVPERSQ